jgi:hypothetical protein
MKTEKRSPKIENSALAKYSVLILALCVMLFALCRPVGAQQPKKVWHIGLFHVGLDHVPPSLQPLQRELKKLGYEEGKNLHFDWRNLPDENAAGKRRKNLSTTTSI